MLNLIEDTFSFLLLTDEEKIQNVSRSEGWWIIHKRPPKNTASIEKNLLFQIVFELNYTMLEKLKLNCDDEVIYELQSLLDLILNYTFMMYETKKVDFDFLKLWTIQGLDHDLWQLIKQQARKIAYKCNLKLNENFIADSNFFRSFSN